MQVTVPGEPGERELGQRSSGGDRAGGAHLGRGQGDLLAADRVLVGRVEIQQLAGVLDGE
nr:hypothetical protein [Enemella evansiae]